MSVLKRILVSLTAVSTVIVSASAFAAKPADRVSIVDVAVAINAATVTAEDPEGEFFTLYSALLAYPEIAAVLVPILRKTCYSQLLVATPYLISLLQILVMLLTCCFITLREAVWTQRKCCRKIRFACFQKTLSPVRRLALPLQMV
jgi:hypothetical protein